MNLSQSEQRLLVHVQEARRSRQKISPQAEALGVGLEGAYRIQALYGNNTGAVQEREYLFYS